MSSAPPSASKSIAVRTRRSIDSRYIRHASIAVNTASSVSINDALAALVRCKPQARATGAITAPAAAIARLGDKSPNEIRAAC